jgi:hypothetical protein
MLFSCLNDKSVICPPNRPPQRNPFSFFLPDKLQRKPKNPESGPRIKSGVTYHSHKLVKSLATATAYFPLRVLGALGGEFRFPAEHVSAAVSSELEIHSYLEDPRCGELQNFNAGFFGQFTDNAFLFSL